MYSLLNNVVSIASHDKVTGKLVSVLNYYAMGEFSCSSTISARQLHAPATLPAGDRSTGKEGTFSAKPF
jgi:hypothetical protein